MSPLPSPDILRRIPLFERLDNDAISVLAEQLVFHRAIAGQLIFRQGDQGGLLYLLQKGKAEVFITDDNGDKVVLSTVNDGEIVGELSVADDFPRSASVRAVEDCTFLIIDRYDLETLFQAHPNAALEIIVMINQRIRDADKLVGERVIRNVNEAIIPPLSFNDRLASLLTYIASDMRFAYFNLVLIAIWVILNIGLIPSFTVFDPFPFGFLSLVVSVEAIFLSLFVLVSQARQDERDKVRNDIEYEINVKNELETRDLRKQVDELQQLVLAGIKNVHSNVDDLRTVVGVSQTREQSNDRATVESLSKDLLSISDKLETALQAQNTTAQLVQTLLEKMA